MNHPLRIFASLVLSLSALAACSAPPEPEPRVLVAPSSSAEPTSCPGIIGDSLASCGGGGGCGYFKAPCCAPNDTCYTFYGDQLVCGPNGRCGFPPPLP